MTTKTHATETKTEKVQDNQGPEGAHSGLDTSGEFRVGAKYTLGVRGDGLMIREAHSGREKEVSEADLDALLKKTYFND